MWHQIVGLWDIMTGRKASRFPLMLLAFTYLGMLYLMLWLLPWYMK